MIDLKGQVVVVTGGGSGIGAGIAHVLASQGCRVVIGGRRMETLAEVVDAAPEGSEPITAQTLDVADDASILAWNPSFKKWISWSTVLGSTS
jgi:NADP-dependent 3-hydroxy acid dehydrogenase YdfG